MSSKLIFLTRPIILILIIGLSSCATCDPNRHAKRGVVIGALAGMIAGVILVDSALVLAIGEGTAGFYIGRSMDRNNSQNDECIERSDVIVEKNIDDTINQDSLSTNNLVSTPIEITKVVHQEFEEKAILDSKLMIDTIYGSGYKVSSSVVPDNLLPILRTAVNTLNTYPGKRLYLIGHTDSTGDARFNHLLSTRRATNAAKLVTQWGVAESRIEIMGHGEEQPVTNNLTENGRSQNRRLEIKIR